MDSGWALVVGAMVALVGSAIVPWIRESLQHKRLNEEARRSEVKAAVLAVGEAVSELATANAKKDHTEMFRWLGAATAANVRLGLVIRSNEKAIEEMTTDAILSVGSEQGGRNLLAFSTSITAWYRGELTAQEARSRFLDHRNQRL